MVMIWIVCMMKLRTIINILVDVMLSSEKFRQVGVRAFKVRWSWVGRKSLMGEMSCR